MRKYVVMKKANGQLGACTMAGTSKQLDISSCDFDEGDIIEVHNVNDVSAVAAAAEPTLRDYYVVQFACYKHDASKFYLLDETVYDRWIDCEPQEGYHCFHVIGKFQLTCLDEVVLRMLSRVEWCALANKIRFI